jgi:predicted nucleotidyltransferase
MCIDFLLRFGVGYFFRGSVECNFAAEIIRVGIVGARSRYTTQVRREASTDWNAGVPRPRSSPRRYAAIVGLSRRYSPRKPGGRLLTLIASTFFWCSVLTRFISLKNNNFMNIDNILNDLINRLKVSDPYKIILFGSCVGGKETDDSDIDLMVILDNDDIAKNYEERQNKKLYIRRLVREINYDVALDILVYSKGELKKLKECGNYFINEIEKTGRIIYEKVG